MRPPRHTWLLAAAAGLLARPMSVPAGEMDGQVVLPDLAARSAPDADEGDPVAEAELPSLDEMDLGARVVEQERHHVDPLLWQAYLADQPKSVVDLQPFRTTETATVELPGNQAARATLIDLNPAVGAWYLLAIEPGPGQPPTFYHLENREPAATKLHLTEGYRQGLVIETPDGDVPCRLWGGEAPVPLDLARQSGRAYAPLCDWRVSLRNPVKGHKSKIEWATDFLRDNVWGGEQITVFVRDQILKDAHLQTGEARATGWREIPPEEALAPPPPRVKPEAEGGVLQPRDLGLPLLGVTDGKLLAGHWYAVADAPGVYASAYLPALLPEEIAAPRTGLNRLDEVEQSAFVYMVAFDLDQLELGYEVGTDHPRLGWSERALDSAVDLSLPGPDGVGDSAPLVRTGQVDPELGDRLVGTFVGGFKRSHGAFKAGDLAQRNHGSHYGFVQDGVVLSRLQPGLATLVVWVDGEVELLTWTEADDDRLWRVRHARQNGVPVLERDPETGAGRLGALVTSWGGGNWSGSVDGALRSLRAGTCQLDGSDRRFLVYGYFSGATPSAMARVFEAYGCSYAMLMDMNALEHTYMAVYRRVDGQVQVNHVANGMEVLDKETGDTLVPRFVGMSDNRDFFYLLRKAGG